MDPRWQASAPTFPGFANQKTRQGRRPRTAATLRRLRLQGSDTGEDALDLFVLCGQMILDLQSRVEDGIGVLICGFSPLVRCGGEDILADNDDAEQNELKEGLADPRHDGE